LHGETTSISLPIVPPRRQRHYYITKLPLMQEQKAIFFKKAGAFAKK